MPNLKIFVSYSRADAEWVERLRVHLAPFLQHGKIDLWDDSRIRPGQDWRTEIRGALESSNVAILLISPDFLASDFIRNEELGPLLTAAERQGSTILPVHVSPSLAARTPLERFQSVNPPDRPLNALSRAECDATLTKVAEAIAELLERSGVSTEPVPGSSREAMRRRIREALSAEGYEWRTVRRLAVLAGASEEQVLEILRGESDIRLGERKRDGARLARLV